MTVAALPNQLPIAFTDPSPHRLVRRGDSGGSAEAARDLVESGRDQAQVMFAIALVVSLPGRTSAELARETERIGKSQGFGVEAWRSLLARRLSEGEDEGRGPIIGSEYSFHRSKPWRLVRPQQAKCTGSRRVQYAIRWWPTNEGAS